MVSGKVAGQKKEGLSSRQPNLLLNLKSNTMKNTVQRYCFFLYLPNFMLKKYVLEHIFRKSVKSIKQNGGIFAKNLVISKNCSNFVPDKNCVSGHWTQRLPQ